MSAKITFDEFITEELVEEAYRKARIAQASHDQSFADTGWRAAIARDSKLLMALDKAAEVIAKMEEKQWGQTFRTARPEEKHKYEHGTTESQLWREAYRLCDEGTPIRNFEWIYGAAAWICGYNL